MQTGVFVGRFQPFHDVHKACIEHILTECDHCIVMIRNTDKTDKNPFAVDQRIPMIRVHFPDESKVSIVPVSDPGAQLSVYIGRDVGYKLIQLDEQTENISATDLRKKLYEEAGKTYDVDAPQKVR